MKAFQLKDQYGRFSVQLFGDLKRLKDARGEYLVTYSGEAINS